jgi:xanthine dehydrogenase accessory factor
MRSLLKHMLELSKRRQPFAVATVIDAEGSVPGKVGSTMVVAADGSARGTVGGAGLEEKVKALCRKALEDGTGGLHSFDLARWKEGGLDSVCGGTVHIGIQVHRALPHLLLFGGGHCSLALARLATTLDWDVTVVDGRAEFADARRFGDEVTAIHQDPVAFASKADLSDVSHAYVLGHSHDLDARTLIALLPRFSGHVGVIGSKSKWANFKTRLQEAGVASARVASVVCPIGVDIGAEAPEEIAVAVAAEVIRSLKSKSTQVQVKAT